MTKARVIFACQNCGHQSIKWLGRCPDCQEWNSFVEEEVAAEPHTARSGAIEFGPSSAPLSIAEVDAEEEPRLVSGIGEFDRAAGGGLVPGSVLLVGGDPGVGKSTLVLQALGRLAAQGAPVLYVTGEESARQVKRRADRLGTLDPRLVVMSETSVDTILAALRKLKPRAFAVDSIQTMHVGELSSAPGSVGQVRESASRFLAAAKRTGMAAILIGHVTKDGSLAGPRVLEHMVDAVLAFEGDRTYPFRVLRAVKNRFGSTNEVGVFEMRREGLVEVANPSELFLAERPADQPGSVVTVSLEGTRPLLVEVQALVSPTSFGTPRRTTIGVDPNRVAMLAAILEKKAGLDLVGCDLFVNVAGGVRLTEPAVDLGLAVALASSFVDKPVAADTLVFGELGLAGEVRSVSQVELRLAEARKMGFARAITPKAGRRDEPAPAGMSVEAVRHIAEVVDKLF
ncbi:MAG: DNA repair protein RadA [Myxococcales bacterium]|nr:MAG: DNA repair protein RadA [Myxococcales bacterium]